MPGVRDQSPLLAAFALLVAAVAVVGTTALGWEWGAGQPVPTVVGLLVAGVAVLSVLARVA